MALYDVVNIKYTLTGSLAIEFQSSNYEDITGISVEVDDGTTVYPFEEIEIGPGSHDDWYVMELLGPIPFGVEYTVSVNFEDADSNVETFSDTITIPHPTWNRAATVRQRLYEILLPLDETEILALDKRVTLFGNSHFPSQAGSEIKGSDSLCVELKAAYITNSNWVTHQEMSHDVSIPLVLYMPIESAEQTSIICGGLEFIWSYLNSQNWYLHNFNISQKQAVMQSNQPEISQDGKIARLEATITVPVDSPIL